MDDEPRPLQPSRLQDMLVLERDYTSERVFIEYCAVAAKLPPRSLLVVGHDDNHEFYWNDNSPGRECARLAVKLIGLTPVCSLADVFTYFEAWFSREHEDEVIAKLTAAGITVRYGSRGDPAPRDYFKLLPLGVKPQWTTKI